MPKAIVKSTRGKHKKASFGLFVKRIHSVHAEGRSASSEVHVLLDDIVQHLVQKLGSRACEVMKLHKMKTLNAKCMQGALGLELGGSIFKEYDNAGKRAVLSVAKAQEKA